MAYALGGGERLRLERRWPGGASDELKAVVVACSWPLSDDLLDELKNALRRVEDWDRFLAVVQRQRVEGLVHHALGLVGDGIVPADVRGHLKQASLALLGRNMLADHRAGMLTGQLALEGIAVAVLKGTPLGVALYGSLAIRSSKDIDLLVEADDVEAADAVLRRCGHERLVPPMEWSREAVAEFRKYRSHYEYRGAAGIPQVELHWRLQHNEFFGGKTGPGNWQALKSSTGAPLWGLDAMDELEYLCLHGASHGWARLKWVADVAALLRRDPEKASLLVERCREQGAQRAAGQGLLLCRDFFGIALPENYRPSVVERGLAWLAGGILTAGGGTEELAEGPLLGLLLHLSHLVLSTRRGYLRRELRNKLLVPLAWRNSDRSRVARWAAPLRVASRWLGQAGRS